MNASASEEVLNAPHLPCWLSDCWEENVVIPQNFRLHENALPLVGGASIEQFSICNRLTSSHMKPVHLYPTPLDHCFCLEFVFICSHFFSHPPCDLTLCSGFRLCKRDEFTGVSLTLLFKPNC